MNFTIYLLIYGFYLIGAIIEHMFPNQGVWSAIQKGAIPAIAAAIISRYLAWVS